VDSRVWGDGRRGIGRGHIWGRVLGRIALRGGRRGVGYVGEDAEVILFKSKAIEELRERIKELEAALKPFADLADDYDYSGEENSDYSPTWFASPTIGQLRHARKILKK